MAARDPEAPDADAMEQAQPVEDTPRLNPLPDDPEVPEPDAFEQAQEVPVDDDHS